MEKKNQPKAQEISPPQEGATPFPYKPVIDGDDVEVDKPRQGVLVHGVNVGELCDGEEQHRAVGGDGTVTCS